jgi:hypothetical protein
MLTVDRGGGLSLGEDFRAIPNCRLLRWKEFWGWAFDRVALRVKGTYDCLAWMIGDVWPWRRFVIGL